MKYLMLFSLSRCLVVLVVFVAALLVVVVVVVDLSIVVALA